MVVTSTCVNSKVLSMLRSLMICCNEPPKVIEIQQQLSDHPVPTFFFKLVSAKCVWIGKGAVVWVNMMYCEGEIVNDRSSVSKWETFPVIVMYGLVCISMSSLKGMSLMKWVWEIVNSWMFIDILDKCLLQNFTSVESNFQELDWTHSIVHQTNIIINIFKMVVSRWLQFWKGTLFTGCQQRASLNL